MTKTEITRLTKSMPAEHWINRKQYKWKSTGEQIVNTECKCVADENPS